MNPNSANQRWSQWVIKVDLLPKANHRHPRFQDAIKHDAATLFRRLFGSAGRVRVTAFQNRDSERWIVEVQVEGVDVHDPDYRARQCAAMRHHYRRGFGSTATVSVEAGLLAGSSEDGTPPAQWVVLPTIQHALST